MLTLAYMARRTRCEDELCVLALFGTAAVRPEAPENDGLASRISEFGQPTFG